MIFRFAALFLALASAVIAAESGTPAPIVPSSMRATLMAAAVESATDNIGSGWCGRGMLSILQNVGLGKGLKGGNGQEWEQILAQAGWKPVRCLVPQKAPLGSVLVYMSDIRLGKAPRGTPGGRFGHVEMVALGRAGERLYVSDNPRVLPGGTVRDNFTGRAWLPPGRSIASAAPPVEQQVDSVLQERTRMAFEQFQRKRQEFTSLPSTTVTK